MTNEQKKWIDNASYEELLERWRFAPVGVSNPLFQGDTGNYYSKVMAEKKQQISESAHVQASKAIGWKN